jgi:hypothetical protein
VHRRLPHCLQVSTDHILFICAGAFHSSKPADMLAELQGRLPIRVTLQGLTEGDLYRVLTEPQNNLVRQQQVGRGVRLAATGGRGGPPRLGAGRAAAASQAVPACRCLGPPPLDPPPPQPQPPPPPLPPAGAAGHRGRGPGGDGGGGERLADGWLGVHACWGPA